MNASQYPTSNQERQMHCVRHITDRAVLPCNLRLHPVDDRPEVVSVTISDPVERTATVKLFAKIGWSFVEVGDKLYYTEVLHD